MIEELRFVPDNDSCHQNEKQSFGSHWESVELYIPPTHTLTSSELQHTIGDAVWAYCTDPTDDKSELNCLERASRDDCGRMETKGIIAGVLRNTHFTGDPSYGRRKVNIRKHSANQQRGKSEYLGPILKNLSRKKW